jgi:hypothetical protein
VRTNRRGNRERAAQANAEGIPGADVPVSLLRARRGRNHRGKPHRLQSPLTTENSGISITAATGIVDLLISAADTAALDTDFDVAQWTYDLEIYNDTVSPVYVERIAEGAVVVFPEVTR